MPQPLITSLQNQRVKDVIRLRQRDQRDAWQQFIIDGAREIQRALFGGIEIEEVFVCESLCRSEEAYNALADLQKASVKRIDVTPPVFQKLAYGDRAEGLIAVSKTRRTSLGDVEWPASSVVAVIEGIEKPGNVGAILRSADAAGITAVIVVDGCTDIRNPNCIRASLGTVFTRPVCEATSAEARDWLQSRAFRVLAARVDGAVNYTSADYRGNVAIVLGSEAEGLSSQWRNDAIQAVRLPMLGEADSLNVSATAAVLFYEALRQRNL